MSGRFVVSKIDSEITDAIRENVEGTEIVQIIIEDNNEIGMNTRLTYVPGLKWKIDRSISDVFKF